MAHQQQFPGRVLANEMLQELTTQLKLESRTFSGNANDTVQIKYGGHCWMAIRWDEKTERVYVFSHLLNTLPKDDAQKLRLYEFLLHSSLLGKEMAGGGAGISLEDDVCIMSTSVDVRNAEAGALKNLVPEFANSLVEWRERCAQLGFLPAREQGTASPSAASPPKSTQPPPVPPPAAILPAGSNPVPSTPAPVPTAQVPSSVRPAAWTPQSQMPAPTQQMFPRSPLSMPPPPPPQAAPPASLPPASLTSHEALSPSQPPSHEELGHPELDNSRALIVGVKYLSTAMPLNHVSDEIQAVMHFLKVNNFEVNDPSKVRVLTEDSQDPQAIPTKDNILRGLKWLAEGSQQDGSNFFAFFGYGRKEQEFGGSVDENGNPMMLPTLCPVDINQHGSITGEDFRQYLVDRMPSRANLTCLVDCVGGSLFNGGLPLVYLPEPNAPVKLRLDPGLAPAKNPERAVYNVHMISTTCDPATLGQCPQRLGTAYTDLLMSKPERQIIELLSEIRSALTPPAAAPRRFPVAIFTAEDLDLVDTYKL